jgi:hypothetical protein
MLRTLGAARSRVASGLALAGVAASLVLSGCGQPAATGTAASRGGTPAPNLQQTMVVQKTTIARLRLQQTVAAQQTALAQLQHTATNTPTGFGKLLTPTDTSTPTGFRSD